MLIFLYQQDEHDDRMKTMNVTAKHGYGAVHLGGREMANGRWSPACGTQHHNVGGREVTPLRPTEQAVTCKRCLKNIAKEAAAPAPVEPPIDEHAAAVAQMRANIDAEEEKRAAARRARNRTNYKRTEKTGIESLRDMLTLS